MKIKITVFLIAVLFFALDANSQWAPNACGLPYDSKFPALLVKDSLWFAATDFGIFFSINENQHFVNVTANLTDRVMNSIILMGDLVYAGTSEGHVYYAGVSYPHFLNTTNNLPANTIVHSLAAADNKIFAGLKDRQVYISSDSGKTWSNAGSGLPVTAGGKIYLFANGSVVYAATDGAGIYVTTNYGSSWQPVNTGLANLNVRSIAFLNSYLFAGTLGGGVFASSSNGQTWQQRNSGLANTNVNAFFTIGSRVVAGTDRGIFISSNYGTSWFERNEGWEGPKVLSFISGEFLHAGTEADMVWTRALEEIVSVKTISSDVPDKFILFRNYPNPFNPSTKIKFMIAKTGFASLKIFDALGKEIAALVNGNLKAGTYETDFNAAGLNSGVYFYKLSAGNYSETKKMVIIK
jgi:hypothetical protein